MKTKSLRLSSSRTREHGIISWANVARVYNLMVFGLPICEAAEDAKQGTKALAVVLIAFVMAAMEGGAA